MEAIKISITRTKTSNDSVVLIVSSFENIFTIVDRARSMITKMYLYLESIFKLSPHSIS